MHHLGSLRILNYVMAGIHALAVMMLVLFGAVGVAVFRRLIETDPAFTGPDAPPPEIVGVIVLVVFGLAGLLLLLETVLLVVAGRAVGQGRGRLLQTILAILQIASFPVGTAYGVYALWVCWSNGPTKAVFDGHPPPPAGPN